MISQPRTPHPSYLSHSNPPTTPQDASSTTTTTRKPPFSIMAALKASIKSATGQDSPSDADSQREASKYRLEVTAGPSYDKSTHKPVHVNTGEATFIENAFIRAKIQVRVRGFQGVPTSCPSSSPYFDHPIHEKDQYSLAFSFVPKVDIPAEGTVWGNDFDHPVRDRLPPGFNTAFKIVKEFIDPGLTCDAYADEPWLYGPSLSCWFAFRIGETVKDGEDFPAPDEEDPMVEGADGSGKDVRQRLGLPENNEKRRKHFLNAQNRKDFTFEKGRCYGADFYNPYLDFGNYALKLPGFSLKVIKYIDQKSHCLRYVFKNRETGDVFLNVNFGLLWGQDLEKALAAEKQDDEDCVAKREDSGAELVDGHGRDGGDGVKSDMSETRARSEQGKAQIFAETASAHRASQQASQSGDASATLGSSRETHSSSKPEPQVNEITNLLEATSTRDERRESKP